MANETNLRTAAEAMLLRLRDLGEGFDGILGDELKALRAELDKPAAEKNTETMEGLRNASEAAWRYANLNSLVHDNGCNSHPPSRGLCDCSQPHSEQIAKDLRAELDRKPEPENVVQIVSQLTEENERLRKAGDRLDRGMYTWERDRTVPAVQEIHAAWQAAKEGK